MLVRRCFMTSSCKGGTMGREDIKLKSYLENGRRYADLWNGAVFGGKEVLKADQLVEANPVLYQPDGQAVFERNRDLVMKQNRDGQSFAIFAVENQKMIDYSMPARIMLQEALEYNRQIRTTVRKNKSAAQRCNLEGLGIENLEDKSISGTADVYCDTGEWLYGFKKTDRLCPVVTLVVYWGEEKWRGARSLRDMINFNICNSSLEKELRRLVPEYPIHFMDVSTFEHFEYFRTELRPLLELFKRRNNKKTFVEYIETNEADWNMDEESWDILSYLTRSKSLSRLMKEKNRKQQETELGKGSEAKTMCKAIDDLETDARNEGIVIGKAEAIFELLEEHGEIPEELRSKVLAQKDMGILKNWLKLAAKTSSIQEFMQNI